MAFINIMLSKIPNGRVISKVSTGSLKSKNTFQIPGMVKNIIPKQAKADRVFTFKRCFALIYRKA